MSIANRKLRILIVTPSLPYPPTWGFGIRVYQMVRYLAQHHRVSLVAYADPREGDKVAALEQTGASVHPVARRNVSDFGKRRDQLESLISRQSFQRTALASREMQLVIDDLFKREAFDVVQVESSQLWGYRYPGSATVLLDEHNIEYELLYRTYKTERDPVRRLFSWVEYLKFRREEQHSWRHVDGCILTSGREESIVREHASGTATTAVPNGVDIDYFQPDGATPDPENIVFVGVMHYRPNVDAAVYFIREILPVIRRQHPNATFTIVGGGAPAELRRLASPNVLLTGEVPDTRPYVSRAGVVVVPMRMGSGTRLKVLEGLAMRRPMVSTALGCEGITARDGQHLLIADEPAEFARAVLRIMADQNRADDLARNGRLLVEAAFSWPYLLGQLEQFMFERRAETRPRELTDAVLI